MTEDGMNTAAVPEMEQRKDSEIENLLVNLEKEIDMLHMSTRGLIQNVGEVLSPELEETSGDNSTSPSPLSPLGRRLFQLTYQINSARKKIDDANERVRV